MTADVEMIWVCRDGREMLISEMDDRHLANAIAMILRHTKWRRRYLIRLEMEVLRRGEPPELIETIKRLGSPRGRLEPPTT